MNLLYAYMPFVVVLGLVIGSFLNVVAIRMLKQESIAFPPSHCVHCQHPLKPQDLVPVFSYLWLRGRCRYCKQGISWAYPVGEAATAAGFTIVYLSKGLTYETIAGLLLVSILSVIVMTDLREMIIPDKVILFGVVSMLLLRLFVHPLPIWDYVAALFIGSGLLYLIAIVTRGGMGGGDIKLFAFLGVALGIKLMLLCFFLSCFFGTLYGIGLWAAGRYKRGKAVPFGPFIALGTLCSYLGGEPFLQWYIAQFL
jgi:leader peptidase (prepilin peptidase) / N-methyltransferase